MSDQATTQKAAPQNPLVVFKKNIQALLDAKELPLPSNVSAETFKNAAIVAVQDNPMIHSCSQDSVFKAIRTLAAAGLVPDGREAALVTFKTKSGDDWVNVCQAIPMVFGLIKMVRRSNEVADIRAHIVYQNEVDQGRFEYTVGDKEALRHEPILFGEKGQPVAAYAIAVLKSGGIVREFMSAGEIDTVRRASSAQKLYKKGERPTTSEAPIGIWKDWWAEMWKKTVIRRLCKRLDMSSEDMRRVMVEQDQESIRDITPTEESPLQRKVREAREAAAQPAQDKPAAPEPEIPDAEVVTPHWTLTHDTTDAFPGNAAWDEGVNAAKSGVPMEECPYDASDVQAADWLAGHAGYARAQE